MNGTPLIGMRELGRERRELEKQRQWLRRESYSSKLGLKRQSLKAALLFLGRYRLLEDMQMFPCYRPPLPMTDV